MLTPLAKKIREVDEMRTREPFGFIHLAAHRRALLWPNNVLSGRRMKPTEQQNQLMIRRSAAATRSAPTGCFVEAGRTRLRRSQT
jgi:hypothetical protein